MMEAGSSSMATGEPFDRSRVLDVRPLRTLKPVFPQANVTQPFAFLPPFTPFQPFQGGFSPFYPFGTTQAPQPTPDTQNQSRDQYKMPAVNIQKQSEDLDQSPPSFVPPLRSFRTPAETSIEVTTGEKRRKGRPRGSRNKQKAPKSSDSASLEPTTVIMGYDSGVSLAEKNDGNRDLVMSILVRFDALRRRLSQLEDSKNATMKAAGLLMNNGIRTNMKKRIGVVPGVEVGDIFYFRVEMCLVGLHYQIVAGIDYISVKRESEEEPLATAIVSSGNYDDATDDTDIIVYTGHGGNAGKKDKQASDQKLERGNLALERTLRRKSAVRVIRGVKDPYNPMSKVYVYDGLYEIKETWAEKIEGCNTFKFKLLRMPGQPAAFAHWKLVKLWKEGLTSRVGLILPDLTSGAESIPVSLVNEIDNEKGPAHFTYSPSLRYDELSELQQPSYNCSCFGNCQPGNLNCSCIRKNGGELPYASNGLLITRRPLMYECGPDCPCFVTCKNKVSQCGLRVRLEVFKTADRGWGLRSWDPIRAGSFICEYAGQATRKDKAGRESEDDEYVFDTTRFYSPIKWNYEPALLGEDSSNDYDDNDMLPPLEISAKNLGNVARFMNHSCSPNVLWQPVAREHDGGVFIHIAFFAIWHIPPMTELTYDYGISRSKVEEGKSASAGGKKKCMCRSQNCRGTFG